MDFNTWKEFYNWGFCTKEQLQQAVSEGMLTQDQYDEIVGIPVPAPTSKVEPEETKTEVAPEAKPVEAVVENPFNRL